MPGLLTRSSGRGTQEATSRCFSPSFPSLLLSLKINKIFKKRVSNSSRFWSHLCYQSSQLKLLGQDSGFVMRLRPLPQCSPPALSRPRPASFDRVGCSVPRRTPHCKPLGYPCAFPAVEVQLLLTCSVRSKAMMSSPRETEKTTSVGEVVEKLEYLCVAGGNAKWCSSYRKQYRSSSKT